MSPQFTRGFAFWKVAGEGRMNRSTLRFLCVSIFVAALVCSAHWLAEVDNTTMAQTAIQLIPMASGLSRPVYVTSAHDGSNRLFIVEQTGAIKIMAPWATAPLSTPFLDISTKITFDFERGLLCLAFHPQFKTNGRFFVTYNRLTDGAMTVSEFKVTENNSNVAKTDEKIILTIPKLSQFHNGSWLDFGPDGYLYITTGDDAFSFDPNNVAQNKGDLRGKILRIDVDATGNAPYASPATNPFFGSTPGRDEIYALGFRNPWRCSFDRATGKLYVGDVQQDSTEEVDIVTHGGNCGWRVFEASHCTNQDPALCVASNYIPPLVEYSHSGGRCAVTGGYVYRGTGNSFPAGTYVFGDYCTGEIFIWNGISMSVILDTNLMISSFGEDQDGEIYVVGLGGTVHRLASSPVATTVSAASFRGPQLAPESIAAAFGQNFATSTQAAPANQPLPTTLAGASVSIIDARGISRLAPLLFVSPAQINFLIPPGAAPGDGTVSFTNIDGGASSGAIEIVNTAPGLFTVGAGATDIPAAFALRVKADGSRFFESIAQLDSQNQIVPVPIDLGPELGNASDLVFLVAFGSGFRFRSSLTAVSAVAGGTAAQVFFAGAQIEFPGLDQANILLPRNLTGRGETDLIFTVDGQSANTVRISVK